MVQSGLSAVYGVTEQQAWSGRSDKKSIRERVNPQCAGTEITRFRTMRRILGEPS
ncbi:hypothetical protein DPMN_098041 [Dreissena polymorpha]|uniref:Uncharacterized protein n=1 Tax=Dreissena polymorpha TaxID=45954 RepID=A0A9D4LCT9_DREPO|nr:hypothetical protein DPMN_098041 [Dreissena polymorpha]